MVVCIPVVFIELVVSLGGVVYALLSKVVRKDPAVSVKLYPRLSAVGVVVSFEPFVIVVARLIKTPAYKDRAPVHIIKGSRLVVIHNISLCPAGILGVTRQIRVHSELFTRPEQTVGSRLFNVDARCGVVFVALLRERYRKGPLHSGFILGVFKRLGQLCIIRRGLILLRKLKILARKHRGRGKDQRDRQHH